MAEASFLSETSFSLVGDRSGEYAQGVRLKADCGADGVKYGTVTSRAYADGVTTVAMAGDALTSNLVSVLHGNDAPDSLCAHAALHATGGRDAIAASAIGAVPNGRWIQTNAPLSGGNNLEADLTLDILRASQEQAEAGTDHDTVMTPLRTAEAIAALAAGGGGVSMLRTRAIAARCQ